MGEPVRVGVIGASGGMGKRRVQQFFVNARSTVAAACARDIRKLAEAVPEKDIRLVAHPEDIYGDPGVDAVVISVPNTLHYAHVKQALLAGKHVLCEYPLTNSLAQYDELVNLARSRGLILHHALTPRAESLHRTMKEALQGLGEPRAAYYRYYGGASWYVQPELRGDLFCALHIHFIDQFVDFFGEPQGLDAHGAERDGQVWATVMMQWDGGLVGTVEFAMGFADKPSYMGTVVTSDGWVGFGNEGGVTTVTVNEGGESGELTPPPDTSQDEDAESFLDEVLGTGGPQCDLVTGRSTLALCLECSQLLAGK
ncbi:MAG: Gfo/Idh/MocA family oxidoreductase [Armatimonadetes bacterium]|nr:Gfo/Idh/MocA family oxidoreductase [Armatimonadota bacterium]